MFLVLDLFVCTIFFVRAKAEKLEDEEKNAKKRKKTEKNRQIRERNTRSRMILNEWCVAWPNATWTRSQIGLVGATTIAD